MKLGLDFETRSLLDLRDVGLDRYAKDMSTKVLMLAWAVDDGAPFLWQPHLGPMPEELDKLLYDPEVQKCAWNYNFERDIFLHVLGIDIPLEQWYDPSVLAAYMSLPIGLDRAGKALNIEQKKQKTFGKKMFSEPSKSTKKMLKEGKPAFYFKDWNSHPAEWHQFEEYCKQDVLAEREIYHALLEFNSPMTEEEIRAWQLDQIMNERGVCIDTVFVENSKKLAEAESAQILAEMKSITGLDNPNSRDQMLEWLQSRGYPYDVLDQEAVELALTKKIPPDVRKILELKQKLGGSAYKKLQSILDRMSADGRLRDQFVYHGAHTGRWSGRGVQLQNLYKPDKDAAARTDEFVQSIKNGTFKPDSVPTMTVIASTIRAAFCAAPGNKLVVGDLAQIESRVLAALSNCKTMIDLYAQGHDLYSEFMSWLLNKTIGEVTKDERARGKVVILGSGFGMGWKRFMEYAASYGIVLTEKESKEAVWGFRDKYPEIVSYWKDLEQAVLTAVGFHNCVHVRGVVIDGRNEKMLRVKLPSGRYIHYLNPFISCENDWGGRPREGVSYTAFDMKGAVVKRLYGGMLTENIVQAVARDILLNGMFEAEKRGLKVVMTIHDEIVAEVAIDSRLGVEDLLAAMKTCPEWGEGMGFVLAAEGWEGQYYKKA